MANSAWSEGWATGSKLAADQRARKELLADEGRKLQVTDLFKQRDDIVKMLPSLIKDSPEYNSARAALDQIHSSVAQIYHPDQNPGALQKDWHWLSGHVRKARPIAPLPDLSATTPGATITDAQTVTMPETHAYLRPGAAPSAGAPGTPAQDITLPSVPIKIPGTTEPTVKPAAQMMTPQQSARLARARAATALDIAGAGLTPTQEAQVDSAKKMAFLRQTQKDIDALYPGDTDEAKTQRAQAFHDVVETTYGIKSKPVWKEFVDKNGVKDWKDITQPIEPGWTATGAESADTRTRADFAAYQKEHPEYKGTMQQWKVEQGQLAKRAVPVGRDDRYIDIERRRALGETPSADDTAYAAAYDLYIKKRVISPMLARAAAQADDRYVQVMDLNDPEKVTFMRAGDAAHAGAGSPQSIGFQTDKAMTKYMTSGKGGENIAYFNTATDHLKLLGEAADALQNGDIQRLNQFGNAFARETGDPAPTNFETVKTAVSGELGKTFTGKGATVEEIAQINQTINAAESPAQLAGVIKYYTNLMDGKLSALKYQSEMGKQGKPAFAPVTPAAGGGAAGGTATEV